MIAPEIGAVIGGLRLDAVAGRGGMGVVYRAHQLNLDRTVAMKIVNPELAGDPEFRERFRREARIAASIDHPHVVPIYSAGEEDGNVFLTMRYVDGTDLASMIAGRGRVEPRDAVEIVAQIGDALYAAHATGLVHRDVKPANILLTRPGGRWHTYLTDFGISKDARDAGMTRTGFVVGSLSYISPEQLQGDDVDGRADQYSLACVLFQALTGEVPFPRDTTAARMFAHMSTPAPRLGEVNATLRGPLEPVLARALAKRPADRYPTAGEFGRAARAALAGPARPVGPAADRTAPRPTDRPGDRPSDPRVPTSHPQATFPQATFPQAASPQAAASPPPFRQQLPFPHGGSGPQLPQTLVGGPSGPHAGPQPGLQPAPVRSRRRGWLLAAVAAVVVAALIAVVVAVVPRPEQPVEPTQLPPTGRLAGAPVTVGVGAVALLTGGGFLWTANRESASVSKIDIGTGVAQEIPVQGGPTAMVFGQGRLWVWNYSSAITPVDATTGTAGTYVDLGGEIGGIAVGSNSVWAALPGRDAVGRVDLTTGELLAPVSVGTGPSSIAIGNGKIYVLNRGDSTVTTLDEVTGTVLGRPYPVPVDTLQVGVENGNVYLGAGRGFVRIADGPSGLAPVDEGAYALGECECGFYGGRESAWVFDSVAGTLERRSLDLRTPLGTPLTGLGTGLESIEFLDRRLWVLNRVQRTVQPIAIDVPV